MNFRSHDPAFIEAAISSGQTAWELDTGNDGLDDVLLGETEEEVRAEVEDWLDAPIPPGWKFRRVDPEEFKK